MNLNPLQNIMAQKRKWHRAGTNDPLDENSVTSATGGAKAICLVKYEGKN